MIKSEVNLYVFAIFPDGEVLEVGRMLSRNLRQPGNFEGFFRYSPTYLNDPKAYAVDPVHLPLEDRVFAAANGITGIHSVFDDSLPDSWGRHILARKGGIPGANYTPIHLLSVLRGGGLGRLLFSEQRRKPKFQDGSLEFGDIHFALEEAAKLEDSLDIETVEMRHLLACGSSAGGARPKVLTRKDNRKWIAKFASINDLHPRLMVSLEQAGMMLAGNVGLNVSEIERISVNNREILLVHRFDTTEPGGRNALISLRTLIGAEDQYSVSYSDLAAIIRKFSRQPAEDLEQLYRQMMVNVLLVNTDDHLQNFSMLHTERGWSLSPAYDIAPNIFQNEQILTINGKHSDISAEDLIAEGRKFGFSREKPQKILTEVTEGLSGWEEAFKICEVPAKHTQRLRNEIKNRLKKIKAQVKAAKDRLEVR